VERVCAAVEDGPGSVRQADVERGLPATVELELGVLGARRLQGQHLPQPRAAARVDHNIAADLQREAVQRRLQGDRRPSIDVASGSTASSIPRRTDRYSRMSAGRSMPGS
jgi:hypothetical protein